MGLKYSILDVFTTTAFAGNPLAVVLDADGLETERMQAIAREFNLSETVFVLTPENPAHSAALRIFTPNRELPFAGHPTVGTAALLALEKYGADDEHEAIITLEEKIGLVRAGVVIMPDQPIYAEFDLPSLPVEMDGTGPREGIATALGLTGSEIGFANHRPSVFSAGVPFTFVPVRDRAALARATPIFALWRDAGFSEFGGAVYVYCRNPQSPECAYRARMFSPEFGIAEDPATGSAAAALAGVVARFDGLGDGRHLLPIEQGFEMGRASLITLEIEIAAGRLIQVRIGGYSVVVARGEFML